MKENKGMHYLDKVTNAFEILIAFLLLVVIIIKIADMFFLLADTGIVIISMDFERILSVAFSFVIGVEFIRMLCKHSPETVIDVLLFAMARQMVLYHEGTLNMLGGVLAIAGLFAVRKFLINK